MRPVRILKVLRGGTGSGPREYTGKAERVGRRGRRRLRRRRREEAGSSWTDADRVHGTGIDAVDSTSSHELKLNKLISVFMK